MTRPPERGLGSVAGGVVVAILVGILTAYLVALVVAPMDCIPVRHTVCDTP